MRFDPATVVGRQKFEAIAMITTSNLRCRITREDGNAYVLPTDYDPCRVRLEIEAGVVKRASVG